jgi:hypothetical protein
MGTDSAEGRQMSSIPALAIFDTAKEWMQCAALLEIVQIEDGSVLICDEQQQVYFTDKGDSTFGATEDPGPSEMITFARTHHGLRAAAVKL